MIANSPVYEQQLALNSYWKYIGDLTMLSGTNRAENRFVRASFYINAVPKTANDHEAMAGAFSMIRNVSVPPGLSTPGKPNISSTIWRTILDHKNRRYFFESVRSPNVFWVNLADMDFAASAPTKKLTLTRGAILTGYAAIRPQPAAPFKFLAAEAD